jgi:radical SAM superfamily enzyme
VAELHPDQVKIHLLHVLRGTRLGEMYEAGAYTPLERERYIGLVTRALTLLPPDTVVARLTGDGAADDLLAPAWSRRKKSVLNDIDTMLVERDLWQGCALDGEERI